MNKDGPVLPVHITQLGVIQRHIHQKLLAQVQDNSSALDKWQIRVLAICEVKFGSFIYKFQSQCLGGGNYLHFCNGRNMLKHIKN